VKIEWYKLNWNQCFFKRFDDNFRSRGNLKKEINKMCDHHFPGKVCIPDPAHVAPDGTGIPVISLDANNGDVFIGGPPGGFGHRGRLVLTNAAGDKTYEIDGSTGTTSQSGDIILLDQNGHERVRISGKQAEMLLKNAAGDVILHLDGKTGDFLVGGNGQDGDVIVRNSASLETMRLDGNTGDLTVGGNGQDGDVIVTDTAGAQTIRLDGSDGAITVGTNGQDGDVIVTNTAGAQTIRLDGSDGSITIGTNGQDGDVIVRNSANVETIRLDGNTGNVTLQGEIVIKDWAISVPDYVFAADYNLPGLSELERYIKTYHHLPEVPPAKEVSQTGINVGGFCMLLLKKLEEMSLYVIQQEHIIQQQDTRLAQLEQKFSS
jgi:hypothetical protein